MAATRNQHNVISRSFGALPNGSLPTYFAGNQMLQDLKGYEIAGKRRRPPRSTSFGSTGFGSLGGVLGAGQMDVPLALALSSVYIGLDFPGARSAAKAVKKLWNQPVPYIQTSLLLIGTGVIVLRQFKVI